MPAAVRWRGGQAPGVKVEMSSTVDSGNFRPFVLGRGKPYFAGARPPLRLVAADPVGDDAVRVICVPA
jgi:hypothetical protein